VARLEADRSDDLGELSGVFEPELGQGETQTRSRPLRTWWSGPSAALRRRIHHIVTLHDEL